MSSFLSGVRVLDLTRMLAGPYCTMLLADMGAEVIKIENPEGGDEIRRMGPPFIEGESAYFISINRNKLGMTLDLKRPEGRQIFLELVEKSDVVVENFRPGVMKRLGLDYPVLRERNPRCVMCSISGFGQTGPYRDRPAYDLVLQAMGGSLGITGEPGERPTRCGLPIGDLAGAQMAAFAIVSALYEREKTGQGTVIDLSLMESLVSLMSYIAQYYFADGTVTRPEGTRHRSVAPYQVFETLDGYVVVAVFGEGFWKSFCEAIGRTDLLKDPRFATNLDRVAHREALDEELEREIRKRPTREWLGLLEKFQVPSCPVRSIDEVLEDPHLKARGMFTTMEHPACGTVRTLANPILTPKGRPPVHHAPLLGEHTNEILARVLEKTPPEIQAIRASGVV